MFVLGTDVEGVRRSFLPVCKSVGPVKGCVETRRGVSLAGFPVFVRCSSSHLGNFFEHRIMGTTSVAEDRRSGPPPPVHCHDGGCDRDHYHDDDASLASSGASSSATTTTGTKTVVDHRSAEADEIERLVYKETRRVQLSRSFFLLMLLAATTVIVTVAYAVFNNKDRDELQISVRRMISAIHRRRVEGQTKSNQLTHHCCASSPLRSTQCNAIVQCQRRNHPMDGPQSA